MTKFIVYEFLWKKVDKETRNTIFEWLKYKIKLNGEILTLDQKFEQLKKELLFIDNIDFDNRFLSLISKNPIVYNQHEKEFVCYFDQKNYDTLNTLKRMNHVKDHVYFNSLFLFNDNTVVHEFTSSQVFFAIKRFSRILKEKDYQFVDLIINYCNQELDKINTNFVWRKNVKKDDNLKR